MDRLRDPLQNRLRPPSRVVNRQEVSELQRQLRSTNPEVRRLTDRSRELQQNRNPTGDWVINRKDIQINQDQELGRGAWGVVYRGRFHGCKVAVKKCTTKLYLIVTGVCLSER